MIHVYLAIKDAREPFPARRLENFFPTAQAPFKHDLYAIFVPGDGHCLFHSVMLAFATCYREQRVKGKFVSRYKIVVDLRKELADKLPEYYSLINNGYTETFGRDAEIDCFKLEYMQAELRSGNYIGYGYMELISRIFDLDIYILDQSLKDIYITDEFKEIIKGNRKSIVLYYVGDNHFEPVGLKSVNGLTGTLFSPNCSFIKYLFARVQTIIKFNNE